MTELEFLKKRIVSVIDRGYTNPVSEKEFNELALQIFDFQFSANPVFRKYCKKLGILPGKVRSYTEISSLPTTAFKQKRVICHIPNGKKHSSARIFFRSSGTTFGTSRRSRAYLLFPELYAISTRVNSRQFLFPDVDRMPLFFLFPSLKEKRDSSLAYMFWLMEKHFGKAGNCAYFVHRGKLLFDELCVSLKNQEKKSQPVALLGATSFLVCFLEYLIAKKERFCLPPGSRAMDTGGMKWMQKEISRERLYTSIQELLFIPPEFVVNQYGMCELTSFYFDNALAEKMNSGMLQNRHKVIPPWMRVGIIDPVSLQPAPQGMLIHYDLANLGTVFAIRTEDAGIWVGDGFEIVGRSAGAEPRGCSLFLRDLLHLNI